jgi:hypothetical protein
MMRLLFPLLGHLLVTLARLARPGGVRAVVAESLAVKMTAAPGARSAAIRCSSNFMNDCAHAASSKKLRWWLRMAFVA